VPHESGFTAKGTKVAKDKEKKFTAEVRRKAKK
jgi:hypothetical protein